KSTQLLPLGLPGRDFHPTAGERQLMMNSSKNSPLTRGLKEGFSRAGTPARENPLYISDM
ncbi:MAG: hypothetical protein JXA21_01230, partial [Anaerolineae bacterium]|nr:hypothetical protein [Anaerolineae bacterium]